MSNTPASINRDLLVEAVMTYVREETDPDKLSFLSEAIGYVVGTLSARQPDPQPPSSTSAPESDEDIPEALSAFLNESDAPKPAPAKTRSQKPAGGRKTVSGAGRPKKAPKSTSKLLRASNKDDSKVSPFYDVIRSGEFTLPQNTDEEVRQTITDYGLLPHWDSLQPLVESNRFISLAQAWRHILHRAYGSQSTFGEIRQGLADLDVAPPRVRYPKSASFAERYKRFATWLTWGKAMSGMNNETHNAVD